MMLLVPYLRTFLCCEMCPFLVVHLVESLPVMTAGDRSAWANFRETYLGEGVSRASLEAIERAVTTRV